MQTYLPIPKRDWMVEDTDNPIHRRFGRLAFETLPTMLGHLTLPHVGMASILGQPLEPRPRQLTMEETKPLTKLSLLKSLLSPSTFPHLLLLALASVALFVLARMEAEVWSAYGFVGFSLAYVLLAPLSKNERLGGMLRYNKDPQTNIKQSFPARLKILVVPLALGFVLIVAIYLIFGENGVLSQVGSFLPATLGSLFVVWAFAQGRFFGLATMNAITTPDGGEESLDGFSPLPSLFMTSTLVVVMTFAVTEGLRFFLSSSSFSLWPICFLVRSLWILCLRFMGTTKASIEALDNPCSRNEVVLGNATVHHLACPQHFPKHRHRFNGYNHFHRGVVPDDRDCFPRHLGTYK